MGQYDSQSKTLRGCHKLSKVEYRFLGGLSLHLNHLIAIGKLRLAIQDTSFWNLWVKFGHKGP